MWRTTKLGGQLGLALLLATVAGCAAGGQLSLRSAKEPEKAIAGTFTDALYTVGDRNQLNILLIAGDPTAPEQVVHIRQFWVPVAGSTPIDRRATNASVRYVVFRGDQVGVYAGAGFLFPTDDAGAASLGFELRHANLRLQDATEGFDRSIRLAVASGGLTARLAPAEMQQRLRGVYKQLRQTLGSPAMVQSPNEGAQQLGQKTPMAFRKMARTPSGTRNRSN